MDIEQLKERIENARADEAATHETSNDYDEREVARVRYLAFTQVLQWIDES